VPLLARLVYEALIRRERRRTRSLSDTLSPHSQQDSGLLAAHLETGRRGERLAYWYLRRIGYIVVARNIRGRGGIGELDLVAWEGPVLAFVEIKTRTSAEAGPPEAAVTAEQQRRIAAAARSYMRGLKRKEVNYRFDIVTVTWHDTRGYELRLIRDAFKG
jgi:putative endonuclease